MLLKFNNTSNETVLVNPKNITCIEHKSYISNTVKIIHISLKGNTFVNVTPETFKNLCPYIEGYNNVVDLTVK